MEGRKVIENRKTKLILPRCTREIS